MIFIWLMRGAVLCRSKAVRLTANRLFQEAFLREAVEEFALAKLRELVPLPQQMLQAAAPSETLALENGSANPAVFHPINPFP